MRLRIVILAGALFYIGTIMVCWIESSRRQDMILLNANSPSPCALISYKGCLTFLYEPRAFSGGGFWPWVDWDLNIEEGRWFRHVRLPELPTEFLQEYCTENAEHQFLGFDWSWKRCLSVSIPYWQLLLIAAVPALWVFIRRRGRSRLGHCPKCGYDLRATLERCPECGTCVAEGGAKA